MKIRKCLILVTIAFLIITILMGTYSKVFAEQNLNLGDLEEYGKQPSNMKSDTFKGKIESFLGLISIVGVALSVIILTIIGLKYMLGSVEERAEYKKELRPYLIGCFILFTGSLVPQIIYDIMQAF